MPRANGKTAADMERNRRMQAGRNAKRAERNRLARAESERRAARQQPAPDAAAAIELYRATVASRRRVSDPLIEEARELFEREMSEKGFMARTLAYRRSVAARQRLGERTT